MKRRFAVSCSKSLGRQRSYVLILDFDQHQICLVKNRGGKEIRKVFTFAECTKLEKERKDQRKLSLTFSRSIGKEMPSSATSGAEKEGYKKTVVFGSKDDRELFCNLVHAVIVTGPKAAQAFKKLDKKGSGSINVSEVVESGLIDKLALNSGDAQAEEINFYQFIQAMASKRSFMKTRGNGGTQNSFLSPSLSKLKRGSKLIPSGSEPEEVSSAISEFLEDGDRERQEREDTFQRDGISPDLESSSVLSDEELAPVLLKGEIPIVQHHAATRLDTATSSRGAVVLTNFRFMYREYQHSKILFEDDGSMDLPLCYLQRVIKTPGESTLRFLCKDYRLLIFGFDASEKWIDGFVDQITRFAFPKTQSKLFAYSHTMDMTNVIDGWTVYDIEKEYDRLGLLKDPKFRLVTLNKDFKLSPTYPPVFVIPASVDNDELKKIVKHRSKGRIPVVTWIHPHTSATLSRCAQPNSGIRRQSSSNDQKLFTALRDNNPTNKQNLYIVDARPYKAAVGNQVMGKGFETASQYPNCSLYFMGIDNIHNIRGSLEKLSELCITEGKDDGVTKSFDRTPSTYMAKLDATQWLHYIRLMLSAAARMARMLDKEGASVVCHCSDGWDRTSQLITYTELMLDPFYRSLEGFATLIEKDWLSFGHKFAERCGHGDPNFQDTQRSPIFIQWIDGVWQLTRQFPEGFEFNEAFLVDLIDHVYSCRFGTFLFNNYQERQDAKLTSKTVSIWSHMLCPANRWKYRNPFYHPSRLPLIPNCSSIRLILWEGLHLRYDKDVKNREGVQDLSIRLYLRYQRLRQNVKDCGLNLEELDSERSSSSSSGHNRSLSVTPIKKKFTGPTQLRIHSWHNRQVSKTTFLDGKSSSSGGTGITSLSSPPSMGRQDKSDFRGSPRSSTISTGGSGRVFTTVDQIEDDEGEADSDDEPEVTGVLPPPPVPPDTPSPISPLTSPTRAIPPPVSPPPVSPTPPTSSGSTPRGSLIKPGEPGGGSSALVFHAKSPSPALMRALEDVASTPIRKLEDPSKKGEISPKTPFTLTSPRASAPLETPIPPPPPTPTLSSPGSPFVIPSPPPPPPPDPDSPLIIHDTTGPPVAIFFPPSPSTSSPPRPSSSSSSSSSSLSSSSSSLSPISSSSSTLPSPK